MNTKLSSPFGLLKQAWVLALGRSNIFYYLVLGLLLQAGVKTFSSLISYRSGTPEFLTFAKSANIGDWVIVIFPALIGVIIIGLVNAWYVALSSFIYRDTVSGKFVSGAMYVNAARNITIHVYITSVITGVIILLGYLLLIIPGIVLAVRYAFALIIASIEDRSLGPIQESMRLVKGRFWQLVGRFIIFYLAYFIPKIIFVRVHPLLGIVWDLTLPIFGLYFYLVYVDFRRTAIIPGNQAKTV